MDPQIAVAVVCIGMGVGLLSGLFGKGGSAIATPLLGAAGVAPIAAVASPLPATIPATFLAAREYWRAGLVDRRLVRWSIVAGFPAVVAGAYLTRFVDGAVLVLATDLLVGALGLRLLLSRGADETPRVARHDLWLIATVAVVVGFASGLLGNSGGFLLAPLFVFVLGRPLKEAFGSSLAVACVLAIPGTIVHATLGHIDWRVTILFAAASMPLAVVGSRLALQMRARPLERIYGVALVTLGALMLTVIH